MTSFPATELESAVTAPMEEPKEEGHQDLSGAHLDDASEEP